MLSLAPHGVGTCRDHRGLRPPLATRTSGPLAAGDRERSAASSPSEATTVTAAPRIVIAAGSCADRDKRVTTPAEQRDSASVCDAFSGVSTDLAHMRDLRVGNFCEGWGDFSDYSWPVGRARRWRGALYDSVRVFPRRDHPPKYARLGRWFRAAS
jgi:hypothetical protein